MIRSGVEDLLTHPNAYWDGNTLNTGKITDTGLTFSVPDSTANDTDNERAAVLSIKKSDDQVTVETTRGVFSFTITGKSLT